MKIFLRKHGKKVSVALMVMALMVSPMLPVVKAANSCKKKSVYMFSFADTMIVDEIDYTYVKKYHTEGEDPANQKLYIAKNTDRTYTDDYLNTFGWTTENSKNLIGTKAYNRLINGEKLQDGDIDGFNPKKIILDDGYGEAQKQMKDINKGQDGNDGSVSLYDALWRNSNFTITVSDNDVVVPKDSIYETEFKLNLPSDAQNVKGSTKNSWTTADLNAMIELEKKNVNVSSDQEIEPYTSGDTTYYMHGSWSIVKNNQVVFDGSRNSVIYNKIKYLVDNKYDTKDFKEMYKKAQVPNVSTTISVTDNSFNGVGDTINAKISRDIRAKDLSKLDVPNSWDNVLPLSWYYEKQEGDEPAKYVIVDDDYEIVNKDELTNAEDSSKVRKKSEFWYFVPAAYEIEYETNNCDVDDDDDDNTGGSGSKDKDDKNNKDNKDDKETGEEPGAGETNQKYGVVSYAIIGTLSAGAVAAYVYAKKGNKFINKL